MAAQNGGATLEEIRQGQRVGPATEIGPEMGVDAFAQFKEIVAIVRPDRIERPEQVAIGAEPGRGLAEGRDGTGLGKAVDAARAIMAQDHRIGDVQRQGATGEAMFGPFKSHGRIITSKMAFTSYISAMISETDLAYFLQQGINALPLAALYAALAFAYGLGFGLARRVDFTPGALFAFAGQLFVMVSAFGWNVLWLTYPAALALGGTIALALTLGSAWLIGVYVMEPLARRPTYKFIIASLGVLIVLMETARIAAGSHEAWLSPFLDRRLVLWDAQGFPVVITGIRLVVLAASLAIVLSGEWLMRNTRAGRIWKAVADDRFGAALCGIDTPRVFLLSTTAAGLIVAMAGILATAHYGTMDFGAGLVFGLKVVMIAAIGASRSPGWSALGAFMLGIAETFWGAYLPLVWRDIAVFSLLVLLALARQNRETV